MATKRLPKEKRDKMILVAGATLALCILLWSMVIRSQQASIKKVKEDTVQATSDLEVAERLVKRAVVVENDLEKISERLRQIEDSMAQGDMYSWIIQTMNKFLMNQRVEIPTFTPPGVGEVGILPQFPYKAATFAVRGTGYFHDFGKFVADFENQFPCARVQNIELEPIGILAARPEDVEKISFRLEIVTLIKPAATL
jgi:Tfp pilus assembly protein PilO